MMSCDILRWSQQYGPLEVGGDGVAICQCDLLVSDISSRLMEGAWGRDRFRGRTKFWTC